MPHSLPLNRSTGTRKVLVNGLIIALVALVGLAAAAVLSGRYQVRPVLSGSMRPGLPVGGVVITKRVPISSIKVRDVIVFHPPGQSELVVHRVIKLTHEADGIAIQTQGDANNTPDAWTATLRGSTAYRAVYSVPLVGYVALWAHGPRGRRVLLLVGLVLLIVAAASSLRRRHRPGKDSMTQDEPIQTTSDPHSEAETASEPRHQPAHAASTAARDA
jgi:signal peptidase I